ncbi:hypothetical protein ABBQ32_001470 [Trebouxia sp. C0010 RCD-2024]
MHFRPSHSLKVSLGQHPTCYVATRGLPTQLPVRVCKLRRVRVASSSDTTLIDRPLKHEHHRRLKVLPRIQYSDSNKDLDFEELLDLLLTSGVHPNKRISRGHVSHQEQKVERDELLRKLQHAVANSITIVVASVFEDKLPSYQEPDAEATPACPDDWTWVTTRRQRKKKKVLAGFARATGDRALTASIHDLVVLPELQGLGLGRKLLAKATNQVTTSAGMTLCCWSLVRLEKIYSC